MKITNEMLAQYLANKQLIKELEDWNQIISVGIKANGGAATKDYMAVVENCERQSVAGKKVFEEILGVGWLEANEFLITTKYQKVVVVERSVRKAGGES